MKKETLSNQIEEWKSLWGDKCSGISTKNVQRFFQNILEKWKAKCKRMEIMSGDVANLELKWLLEKEAGEKLINHSPQAPLVTGFEDTQSPSRAQQNRKSVRREDNPK